MIIETKNNRIINYIFFSFIFALSSILFENELLFIIKIIILLAYLSTEILDLKKHNPANWFLSPVVLASMFTFALSFGLTNIVYFFPNSPSYNYIYQILGPNPFKYLNKAMDYIVIASFFMWFGYKSILGRKIFLFLTNNHLIKNFFFRKSNIINYTFVFFLLLISVAAKLLQIQLGLYFYAGESVSREVYGGIWNILYGIGTLGSLALVIFSLGYFAEGSNRLLFYISLIMQVGFGLLSGMKSEILFPFLIIAFTYYLSKKKFNKFIITAAIISVIFAYVLIEPFRILRNSDSQFRSDPEYIISSIIDGYELNKRTKLVEQQSIDIILFRFLSRVEYTLTTARAIQYEDQVGLDTRAQDFRERLLTVPLQAYIPRAIWSDKPLEDSGKWYSVYVWGSVETSSVAYSPIGFAYFAGGLIPLIIIFFTIGVLQKTLFNFLKMGTGGIVIYFGLLLTVVLIDSKVNTMFVNWLRNLPVLFILQAWIYKK